MLWVLLAILLGLLLWGTYPRAVAGDKGRGADESSLAGPVRSASSARIGTFNIHGAKGRDGRRDLSRIGTDLAGIEIAALQEVHDTWGARRQLQKLAERLGLASLSSPTRRRGFRDHRSNGLLTRYPVGTWQRIPLPTHPGQRFHFRNLTIAQVNMHRPIWVLFTHLNRNQGQEEQLARVMQEFEKYSPAVLMGDFNMNRKHRLLREYLARDDIIDPLGLTLDQDDPERVDWILCRGVSINGGGVIASGASDHPLYWCDIEI